MIRFVISIAIAIVSCLTSFSANIVTCATIDSVAIEADALTLGFRNLSNADDLTRISFVIQSTNTPFTIYDVKWKNLDSIISSEYPFSLVVFPNEVKDKTTRWDISVDFPFKTEFDRSDELILLTDKGEIRCRTSFEGELLNTIDLLTRQYEDSLTASRGQSRMAWIIVLVCIAAVIGLLIIMRSRISLKHRKIEELSVMISDNRVRNSELMAKIDELYGKRLETLNMLCNEYFEKNSSDKLKISLYNEVENYILSLKGKRRVDELTDMVNTYLDNILDRVKTQIPELKPKDILFLTYLYAGFSPRAICIFTDIKIKNFYNRRSRLKDRILESDAIDKDYFVSKM